LGRDWPVKKKFKKITLKFVIFLRKFLTTFWLILVYIFIL
jgi:hypothetical protein